jgi:hypothetical protein
MPAVATYFVASKPFEYNVLVVLVEPLVSALVAHQAWIVK